VRERVLQFGDAGALIGIVTEPESAPHTTGVILMNSGLIHRVGPNRLYVGLARELSRSGFTVLRMDFSGVGDSDVRRDHLPYEKSSLLEVRDAMGELTRMYGIERFLLAGICSGAEAAVQIAEADARVIGILPIEFYGYETAWYWLYSYRRRLLQVRSWRRLLTGRSELLGSIISRLWLRSDRGESRSAAPPSAGNAPSLPVRQRRERVARSFQALAERGVRVCLVYGAGPSYFNYRTLFRRLRGVKAQGLLRVVHLKASDHTFTLLENQQQLREAVVSWAVGEFGVGSREPAGSRGAGVSKYEREPPEVEARGRLIGAAQANPVRGVSS
jgi:pimeloyl-ACP methyl ester carboxylesterase